MSSLLSRCARTARSTPAALNGARAAALRTRGQASLAQSPNIETYEPGDKDTQAWDWGSSSKARNETPRQKQSLITFEDPSGVNHTCEVPEGQTILDVAKSRDLEIEGACNGECACSTCHVIVGSEDQYQKLQPATDQEDDMLDLAYGLTETSRLGCQVRMTQQLSGLKVKLPGVVQDARTPGEENAKL